MVLFIFSVCVFFLVGLFSVALYCCLFFSKNYVRFSSTSSKSDPSKMKIEENLSTIVWLFVLALLQNVIATYSYAINDEDIFFVVAWVYISVFFVWVYFLFKVLWFAKKLMIFRIKDYSNDK